MIPAASFTARLSCRDSGQPLCKLQVGNSFLPTSAYSPASTDPREYSVTHQVLEDVDDDGELPLLFHSTYRFRYPVEEQLAGPYLQQESWSAPKPTVEDMNSHIDPSAMLPLDSTPTSTFFTGLNPYANAVGGEAYSWSSHPSSAPEVPMFYAGGGGFDMQASATAHLHDPSRYVSSLFVN